MTFVSRSQWGARKPTSTTPFASKTEIVVHWSAQRMNGGSHDLCIATVKGIQAAHMDGRNSDNKPWNDIAYNLAACPHSYVFECRGTENRSAANGTTEANATKAAVCYLGGEGDEIPSEGWAAVREAIDICVKAGFPRKGRGHRDVKAATACPGDVIYGRIPELFKQGSLQSTKKEVPDMPLYVDAYRWPNGDSVQLFREGSVKCFGARFWGSMHDLKPEAKKTFGEAAAIKPVNPADSQAGYVVYDQEGPPEGWTFDESTKQFFK